MKYQKGHKQSNTGRTHFKKGQVSPRKGIVLSDEIKTKISLSLMGHTVSEEGKRNRSEAWKGEKNPLWKGGITPLNDLLRKSKEYKKWLISVYKKDKYICQDCGIKCRAKNIIAHHIKGFADYPEFRFDVSNGITLCRNCHFRLHHQLRNGVASLAFAMPA